MNTYSILPKYARDAIAERERLMLRLLCFGRETEGVWELREQTSGFGLRLLGDMAAAGIRWESGSVNIDTSNIPGYARENTELMMLVVAYNYAVQFLSHSRTAS